MLGQVKTVIAAQMTALLQLTDIMSAAKAKKVVNKKRWQLKKLLRRRAIYERTRASYKCGKREILWICNEIAKEMEQWNEEEEYILKGLRQSGMLAYRPDYDSKQLVPAEGDWCDRNPLGQGGKVEQSWIEERFAWLSASGAPVSADWTRQSNAKKLEECREVDYCLRYEEDNGIDVNCDEQALFDEHQALLQKHPKRREKFMRTELLKCTEQGNSRTSTAELTGLEGSKAKVQYVLQTLTEQETAGFREKVKKLGFTGKHLSDQVFTRGHSRGPKAAKKIGDKHYITVAKSAFVKGLKKKLRDKASASKEKKLLKETTKFLEGLDAATGAEEEPAGAQESEEAKEPKDAKLADGPLAGATVRLCREDVPSRFFGKTGKVVSHVKSYVLVDMHTGLYDRARDIHEDAVVVVTGKETPKKENKKLSSLDHAHQDVIIGAVKDIVPVKVHPQQWLTQEQVKLAFEMLQWFYQEQPWQELVAEGNRVRMMDISTVSLRFQKIHGEELTKEIVEQAESEFRRTLQGCRKLLVPIVASNHWVLLVCWRRRRRSKIQPRNQKASRSATTTP